jgi:translation initiation factor 1
MSRLFSGTPFDRPPLCERCGKAPADCRCMPLPEKKRMSEKRAPRGPAGAGTVQLDSGLTLTPENAQPPADQQARIRVEKRKGNRIVTLIAGLEHPGNDLPALCTLLKTTLATGGSVQGRAIEIQGDHAVRTAELLAERGLKTRLM